jgi:tRNA pseudouridine32 synthase/23S rRNA pseudouridine746 synthase
MDLLYEDDALLAVAKEAGVTVIPARDEPPGACLQHRLQEARRERLWVVHRIDRDTSGVVLFARTAAAHRALSLAFEARAVDKTYLAYTRGLPSPREGVIDVPLHPARKGRMRPARPDEQGALASRTRHRVLAHRDAAGGPVACVEASPETGRQHQLRVHLRAVGAPLLVDAVYGRVEAIAAGALGPGSPALGRLTLHARRVELEHPARGGRVTIEAPLPDDLAALDRWLAGA